jgi:hypothetical protein
MNARGSLSSFIGLIAVCGEFVLVSCGSDSHINPFVDENLKSKQESVEVTIHAGKQIGRTSVVAVPGGQPTLPQILVLPRGDAGPTQTLYLAGMQDITVPLKGQTDVATIALESRFGSLLCDGFESCVATQDEDLTLHIYTSIPWSEFFPSGTQVTIVGNDWRSTVIMHYVDYTFFKKSLVVNIPESPLWNLSGKVDGLTSRGYHFTDIELIY